MQILPALPWIIKVLGSLAIILIVNSLLKNLTISVVLGTLTLALLSGHSLTTVFSIVSNCLFSVNHLSLMIAVAQIYWLSSQWAKTGMMQELVVLIQSRLSPRASIAILPAVLGFLPVPGGALFSAPLVDSCDREGRIDPTLKSVVNYWFRHVWEFWCPLYPGILLAMEITGLTILQVMLVGLPLSFSAILAGYLFFLREIPGGKLPTQSPTNGFLKQFLLLTSPIIIVIGIQTVLPIFFSGITEFNKYLPISIGIIMAYLFLQILKPLTLATWREIFGQKKIFSLLLLISMIMVYVAFIEAKLPNGTPLVTTISEELSSFGIPITVMAMLIPFVSAITSGLSLGFVGPSFPIIFSMLGPNPSLPQLLSTLVLAYGFGLMGVMLSPVHVCLIVSNEFFEAKLTPTLTRLLKPAFFVILYTIAFHFLISLFPG